MSTTEPNLSPIIRLICSYISDKLSDGCGTLSQSRVKINSKSLFLYIQDHQTITEQVFVQALAKIKQCFPKKYAKIELPTCWDGGSHIAYPEAYPSKEKICCKTNMALESNIIYPYTNRIWDKGMYVYVPQDHPKIIQWLLENVIEQIEED